MWGIPWSELPASVRGRIPRELTDRPQYYRHPFVALPRLGYTHLLENMFDGVEIVLNASLDEWTTIPAHVVIYTGRPDLIPAPGESVTLAEKYDLQLPFRTLDIRFALENPGPEWGDAICLHACSPTGPWTRKTAFARMTGGQSPMVSTEYPQQAGLGRSNTLLPHRNLRKPVSAGSPRAIDSSCLSQPSPTRARLEARTAISTCTRRWGRPFPFLGSSLADLQYGRETSGQAACSHETERDGRLRAATAARKVSTSASAPGCIIAQRHPSRISACERLLIRLW